ncbi:MAG: DUF1223 domain-containing protein [Proteobacteria bacterium]|nr:DUF1223 domain-containing protein [Pseudomonadota bacterium]
MVKTLKSLVTAASLAVAFSLAAPAPVIAAEATPLTVVELFTSQGCSSCPPADKFLGELAKRDDVLALSVHVDYWDYIGWKDPFADPRNTKRQRDYAKKLGLRYVYTPQMVIQGAFDSTGSDRAKVQRKITEAAKLERLAVKISRAGDGVRVALPNAGRVENAAIWLAVFDSQHDTEVKRGENSGQTLRYHNVVRGMTRIGTWTGQAVEITTKASEMAAQGRDGCAVIVQSEKTGRILGAARLDLNKS